MPQPLDAMEYIWERLPKNKDGKTIHYLPGDVPYLYQNGFVDAVKYTYEEWQKALLPFKDRDGEGYTLDKQQFLALRLFRYNGPSHEVFEPEKLRDGPWPEDELEYLFENSIKYSSTIPKDMFWRAITTLKSKGFMDSQGEFLVNDTVKKQFQYLVEKFPSPQRRLEKEVRRLREERDVERSLHQKNRDASTFTMGTSQSEENLEKFKDLEIRTDVSTKPKQESPEDKGVDIKSLRKPTGKVKG